MLVYGGGEGILNSLINKLPLELHIPGYSFCGPGTKLEKRLSRGDQGINPLDSYCKEHDIAYSQNKSLKERHKADRVLEEAAWNRFKTKDTPFGEKVAAWAVTTTMKAKRKFGLGVKKSGNGISVKSKSKRKAKLITFNGGFINKIKRAILRKNKKKDVSERQLIKNSLIAAKRIITSVGSKKNIKIPRVIPIPTTTKEGGVIPFLLPIFAGLSALGSLAGGAAGVAKVIHDAGATKKQFEEGVRHNKKMEIIAQTKKGEALYLKPYKKGGSALYFKRTAKNRNSRTSRHHRKN